MKTVTPKSQNPRTNTSNYQNSNAQNPKPRTNTSNHQNNDTQKPKSKLYIQTQSNERGNGTYIMGFP